MNCPQCKAEMAAGKSSGVPANRCDGCGGVWIDLAVVEPHVRETELGEALSEKAVVPHIAAGDETEVTCPRCESGPLRRTRVKETAFDGCAVCRGMFLTAGDASLLSRTEKPLEETVEGFSRELPRIVGLSMSLSGFGVSGDAAEELIKQKRSRTWAVGWIVLVVLLLLGGLWLDLLNFFGPGRWLHTTTLGPELVIHEVELSHIPDPQVIPFEVAGVVHIENLTDETFNDCRVVWKDRDGTLGGSKPFVLESRQAMQVEAHAPRIWKVETRRQTLRVHCKETTSPPHPQNVEYTDGKSF